MKTHISFPPIELLESSIAPAAIFVNPTTATFTDEDGDLATVKFTKPFFYFGKCEFHSGDFDRRKRRPAR